MTFPPPQLTCLALAQPGDAVLISTAVGVSVYVAIEADGSLKIERNPAASPVVHVSAAPAE